MGLIKSALKYRDVLKFSVIPIVEMQKIPDGSVLPLQFDDQGNPVINSKTGKQKTTWKPFQKALPTDEDLQRWFSNGSARNIAVVTGKVSGISVIDIDSPEAEERLFKVIPETTVTPTATTPRGGKHLYFKYDARIPSVSGKVIPNVDTKSDGGYVVAAPSVRKEGALRKCVEPSQGIVA